MTKPSLSLSGAWTGVYDYDNPGQDAVSFVATLTDIAGVIWGETSEPNSFSPIPDKDLVASISGLRTGREVTFSKEYQASVQGGEEVVFYAGQVSEDGQRIKGTWRIQFPFEVGGPFVMDRADGRTAVKERTRFASVEI
ncbi:hypothetical protein ACERZ8_02340 [Tateyamaria armeniaca]|uniref:DUF1579 domain-containing protein n=1 Tax=Tateyamaria armeniaca TaxID=2518930 RepID=A0ABW8UP92_9RHOB